MKFLGHKVYSYGQLLFITFASETPELLPDHIALVLEGSGITLSADLSSQPVLGCHPGLTPRHSFTIRYKTTLRGFIIFECLNVFEFFVPLENIKVLACMLICLFCFESVHLPVA